MTGYQVATLRDGLVAALPLLAIAALYWAKAENRNVRDRVAVAAPGVYFVLVFALAIVLSDVDPARRETAGMVVAGLEIIGLVLVGIALLRFQGPKLIHLLAPVLLLAAGYLWLIAGMSVAHDWL